jgi:hypothetical protein
LRRKYHELEASEYAQTFENQIEREQKRLKSVTPDPVGELFSGTKELSPIPIVEDTDMEENANTNKDVENSLFTTVSNIQTMQDDIEKSSKVLQIPRTISPIPIIVTPTIEQPSVHTPTIPAPIPNPERNVPQLNTNISRKSQIVPKERPNLARPSLGNTLKTKQPVRFIRFN